MSDDSALTAPIVLSVVSLAATIVTTLIGAYITYYSDERKAQREANKILLKYRDPLLLSATDLQARCYGICDRDLLEWRHKDKDGETLYNDTLYIYTAYVVGCYLSWVWILRRQAQFVALVSSSPPRWSLFKRKAKDHATTLTEKIEDVRAAFNADTPDMALEKPFLMFKAHQQAIGEIMSCQDSNGEYYCMGFATFTHRWKNGAPHNLAADGTHNAATITDENDATGERMAGVSKIPDQVFRDHFRAIEDGITMMYEKRMEHQERHPKEEAWNQGSDGRLRRLQHLLLDLMDHLDTTGTMINKHENSPAHAAPNCNCSLSPCHCARGCKKCRRNITGYIKQVSHCDCQVCGKPHRKPTQAWTEVSKQVGNTHVTTLEKPPRTMSEIQAAPGAERAADAHQNGEVV